MILSDITIEKMIKNRELLITPLKKNQIQSASLDVRLGNTFSIMEESPTGILHIDSEIKYRTLRADKFLLLPGKYVLVTTMEMISMPDNLTAHIEGRSSLGRIGIFIQNSGWISPGFKGELTLKLYNANSQAVELNSGIRVAQLVFEKTDYTVTKPYKGKYQYQQGATGSKLHTDKEIVKIKD